MPLYRINEKLIFFVHIPKTGGSSIETALKQAGPVSFSKKPAFFPAPAQHFHADIFNILIPTDLYDMGFSVCRNPYTRLISEYRDQVVRGRLGRMSLDIWIQKIFRKYKKDSFLHHNHIRPQVEFISDSIDIFKFEEGLERVVQSVFSYCGMEYRDEVPRIKRYQKTDVELKYTSLKLVENFYQKDFESFGYDPTDLSFVAENQVTLI